MYMLYYYIYVCVCIAYIMDYHICNLFHRKLMQLISSAKILIFDKISFLSMSMINFLSEIIIMVDGQCLLQKSSTNQNDTLWMPVPMSTSIQYSHTWSSENVTEEQLERLQEPGGQGGCCILLLLVILKCTYKKPNHHNCSTKAEQGWYQWACQSWWNKDQDSSTLQKEL